jgi:uroporphyrinogen-III decarboxylase
MMTRRERLMATLRGEPVDRPPVSFYEIGGWTFDTEDPDPFNIYNSPEWWPLIRLAEEETDLIRMMGATVTPAAHNPREEFAPEDYTVLGLTEPSLFHQLQEKHTRYVYPLVEYVAQAFPGHLWRVVGSEYASEPFLPPRLYAEYEVRYTKPMVETIQKYGGFARLHSHGRLKNILPYIVEMGVAGLDPVEPPPQGDMQLIDVRRGYGKDMVLFGNIEASDIEMLSPAEFETRVVRALREGTAGEGRGFVLHPSACPYGRHISADVMANYETMVRLAKEFGG